MWTALTIVTVLAAVLVGIGKLLMPYSDYYQPQLEDWLSKAFNQPVSVESFDGEWKAFGPRISLQGVTFMPVGMQSEIAIKQAALDVKPLNALIPGRPLYSFRIIGADLTLERTHDGRYVLSGLGVSNRGSGGSTNPQLRNVALNGEVRLEDSVFSFDDPDREIHVVLINVNGRLKMEGDELAAEIQARISDRGRSLVVGDIQATVQVKLDSEQHLSAAAWHVKTGELMLAELVRQLPHHPLIPVSGWLNAELWGTWQLGDPQKMQGVADLRDARLSSPSGPLVIDHLNSRFNWRFDHRRNWQIDLSDLNVEQAGTEWETPRLSVARNLPENLGLWVSADYIRLDFPLQLTQRIMASYNTAWPAAIPRRAQGSVTNLDLLLDAKWRLRQAVGSLDDGHFWGWGDGPEISGLNAEASLQSDGGGVSFSGQTVKLDWTRVFRRQLTMTLSECYADILLAPENAWQLDLNNCHIQNSDISAYGRARAASDEGKPEVDINVVMERGDISRFSDYWPENVLKERTLHWLRTSLLSGMVTEGRFSMLGDMDDFPFKNHRGRMQAIANVANADLRYADHWPRVRQVDATVEFEGAGMYIEGQVGRTVGASVDQVSARIGDFKKPVLDVRYRTKTNLDDLTGFIKQTPLLDGLALNPDQFVLTGPAEIDGHLHTRLGVANQALEVTGAVQMREAYFQDTVSGIELKTINGVLNYEREGLNSEQIAAEFRNYPVSLGVSADWDADEVFRASLHGDLPADRVIPDDLMAREPMFRRAIGISPWDISLSIAAVEGQEDRDIWLNLSSSLEGTMMDFPAPLNKPVETSWPLLVRYPIRSRSNLLTAHMPGRVQLKMELDPNTASPTRAVFQLGSGTGQLPPEGLFSLSGSAEMFDLDGWVDLVVEHIRQSPDGQGLALQSANIEAMQIKLFDRLFDDVGLSMTYGNDVLDGIFDGNDIAGKIRYHKNEEGNHSLTGEFERLIMPDPVTGGVTMETDPSELPEIHFFSEEFSYLGLALGETRIEGYPIQNGFHVDSIEAESPDLELSASGDWFRDDDDERSDFNIRITSESLGTVLQAMDISSAMQGGQTLVHFDAWWEGPPAAFALERLNGEMDISVIQGNILTAEPGAGRMLGLLSLTELPRRLAMDFRDVFSEGFSFDEASGTMKLENGNTYTDDLKLSSTAAEIAIVGHTDLVAQTFDYEFSVRPGVSKALPVLGAIAGGPAGAAAGLALQALLRDALGDAAEARYTIRGPWEDPQVEPVEDQLADGTQEMDVEAGKPDTAEAEAAETVPVSERDSDGQPVEQQALEDEIQEDENQEDETIGDDGND